MVYRVVHAIKYFPPVRRASGIMNFAHALFPMLAREVDLTVLTWCPRGCPSSEEDRGYRVVRYPSPWPLTSANWLRKYPADLVIVNSGVTQPSLMGAYFAPIVYAARKAPVLFSQCSLPQSGRSGLLRRVLDRCSGVIAFSPAIAERMSQNTGHNIVYIPPGVPVSADPIQRWKPQDDKIRFGFFGHFLESKGADALIQAFASLDMPNAELVVAGQYRLPAWAQRIADANPRVSVVGLVPDVHRVMQGCDAVVLPYRSSVSVLGIALVALEAMSMGIPVIGTDTESLRPLLVDGYNGMVCADIADLPAKLEEFYWSPSLREKLSAGALVSTLEYSLPRIAQRHLETYLRFIVGTSECESK